jgi:acyl-CoA synthetase (AMP-forming)/AMP-acid ligase II
MMAYDYLDLHARQQPNSEFAVGAGKRVTYSEARDVVNRIAHAMIASQLAPGDRVAILMGNSVETVLVFLGALKAGVVPTPINCRLKPSDWLEICADAEAKLLVSDAQFTEQVDSFRQRLKRVRCFIGVGGPCTGWQDFEDWTARESRADPMVPATDDDDALQMYTSGTTGQPRSVVLTHRAVTANIAQFGRVAQFQPDDRFLLIMPMFHAAGFMVMLHAISSGASLVIHKSFAPKAAVDAMDKEGVTVTMLAPTMIQRCLTDVSDIAERKFQSLRLIIYGASAIKAETLREAMKCFRCDFAQRYGTTETLSLTWLDPADHRLALKERPDMLRSAGRPLPGVQIRVVDTDGQSLPTGETGEFIASGPQLMRGYWKSGDETSLDIDGKRWLRTGDSGFIDRDGYVCICDRVKDVIVSGGENIYPREIEEVLLEHPDVCQAAVIGVPDVEWGETVKAIVILRAGAHVSDQQVIDYCRERIAGFKLPHSVDFVTTIPRNSGGKVLKHLLREPYWNGQVRRI